MQEKMHVLNVAIPMPVYRAVKAMAQRRRSKLYGLVEELLIRGMRDLEKMEIRVSQPTLDGKDAAA